jgi:hippurate hydrolase
VEEETAWTLPRLDNLQSEIEERYGEKISALRRDIHREPELGFDTEKTARKVLDALEGLPLEIETGVAQNGIVATLAGGGEGPRSGCGRTWTRSHNGGDRAAVLLGGRGQDARLRPRRHTSMLVGAAHALSG